MKPYLLVVAIFLAFGARPVYALECGGANPPCLSQIIVVLRNAISLLAPAAGIALLIMLIIGGYQFITSGGDPKAVGGARSTLTYAILGIFLVILVWLILLVIRVVTDIPITVVEFPTN